MHLSAFHAATLSERVPGKLIRDLVHGLLTEQMLTFAQLAIRVPGVSIASMRIEWLWEI